MHKKTIGIAAILMAAWACSAGPVEDGFAPPPDEAKPRTLWHWMNGHVSKDGIRADLEAMKDAGLGGAVVFNMFWGRLAPGPVPFNTKAWDEHINYAADEAERLGLELTLTHGSGMSDAGGPWVSPSNSVFHLTCSETRVGDGETFRGRLPRVTPKAPEEWFNGFFRDIAVLAFPLPPVEAMGPQTFDVRREGLDRIVSAGGEAFTLRGVCFTVKYSGNGPWYRRMYADVAASDVGKFADKKAVTGILNDSWENGSQNWTHGLEKNFEKRYGYSILPYRVFRKVNHYVLKRMARFLNRKSQRYYRLKFADTYYGEMTHYGLYRLA